MTVVVLAPDLAHPDPGSAVGVAGALGFEDAVDLEGPIAVETALLGDEFVARESPPDGRPGGRIARGAAPAAERTTLVGDRPVDQAVFDAEFVAMVLAEAPWAELEPGPASVPPRAATGTRREPARRSPRGHAALPARSRTATGVLRESGRRPGPGPRSPPWHYATSLVWSTA